MSNEIFVGRKRELAILEQLSNSNKSELLILYGRRRVGKTRLLTHWLEKSDLRSLYWVAEPSSPYDQLRSFSQAIYRFENPDSSGYDQFSYASWHQALEQLGRIAQRDRFVLMIDEFTFLLEKTPEIAGIFQNAWDHVLKNTHIFLCLSGSHLGMMHRHILSYQAPLYGRATTSIQLQPLTFADTRSFFPNYQADERVALYAMLGGIPAYWELFDANLTISDNLKERFLGRYYLNDEPRLLLQDFVTDIRTYVAILRAIAFGYRTPTEIGRYAGVEKSHITMYLHNLIETGFVERRLPVTAGPRSRAGRHHITDPFLRFYYRFLAHRQAQFAQGLVNQALTEITRHLRDFIGTHTWEELCREWLLRATDAGLLMVFPDQVGSAWTRKAQIDVVGLNRMEKTLVLGECKWGAEPTGRSVLTDLVAKTGEFVPKDGQWTVYYLGFARAGWTDAAHSYMDALPQQEAAPGTNWTVVGGQLLDLEQVDSDLVEWTA